MPDGLGDALRKAKSKPLRDSLTAAASRTDPELDMFWRREWSASKRYKVGDTVSHDCRAFVCIKAHKGSEPPSSVWDPIVCKPEKGEKGDKGNTGIGMSGPAGPEGPQGPPGPGSELTIEDEGVVQGTATTLDFTGAGVTASVAGGTATVNVPGGGAGGTPSNTVVSEETFGQADSAGVSTDYSRGDHTHGTPAAPSVPTAGDTVVTETAYGQASAGGTDPNFSREDHTHGTPAVPAHSDLTGVTANQHHAEDHDHDGSPTQQLVQANTHGSPDTDAATTSLHHTIGGSATQAAAGNHTHTGLPLDWGETGDITTIQPDDAAAGGSLDEIARADHKHGIVAATAGASAVGDSAAEGSATSFARSDHRHSREAFAGTGSATTVAHSDHTHAGVTYIDRTFADVTKANSAATEVLYTFSIPAADLAGKGFSFEAWGTYLNNTGASRTLAFLMDLATDVFFTETSQNIGPNATARDWFFRANLWVPGSSSAEVLEGYAEGFLSPEGGVFFSQDNAAAAGRQLLMRSLVTAPANVTSAKTFSFSSRHSAASANLSITLKGAILKPA